MGVDSFVITPYGKMNFCTDMGEPQLDVLGTPVKRRWEELKTRCLTHQIGDEPRLRLLQALLELLGLRGGSVAREPVIHLVLPLLQRVGVGPARRRPGALPQLRAYGD